MTKLKKLEVACIGLLTAVAVWHIFMPGVSYIVRDLWG